jgi:hypothetical protein
VSLDIAIALIVAAFGFGYGLASRACRKDIDRILARDE